MLAQFQARYPTGSLISELLTVYQGKFVVRVSVQVEGLTRATGMAAAETVELAEDRARSRALAIVVTEQAPLQLSATAPTPPANEDMSEQALAAAVVPKPIPQTQQHPSDTTEELKLESDTAWATSPLLETTPIPNVSAEFTSKSKSSLLDPEPDLNLNSPPLVSASVESEDWEPTTTTPTDSSHPLLDFDKVTPLVPRHQSSPVSTGKSGRKSTAAKSPNPSEPIDFSDIIAKTDVELDRIGWSKKDGRDYLLRSYNKPRRDLLTEEQLLEFLHHLESQPDKY